MKNTNNTVKDLPAFVVFIVCERQDAGIFFFDDEKAAIDFANDELVEHVKNIGCADEFDDCNGVPPEKCDFDWGCFASANNYNAWCNLKMHWDAWIICLKREEVDPVQSRHRVLKKYTVQEIQAAIETYEKTIQSLKMVLNGKTMPEIAQAIWAGEAIQNVYKMLDVRIARGNNKTSPPIKMEEVLEDCQFPYPQNLMMAAFGEIDLEKLPKDIDEGLAYVMNTLTPREQRSLELLYKEDYTREEVARDLDVTQERVRQIINKGLHKLRHPSRAKYLFNGYAQMRAIDELKEEKAACITSKQQAELLHKYLGPEIGQYLIEHDRAVEVAKMFDCAEPSELPDKIVETFVATRLENMPIEDLGLCVRAYNALHRAELNTVRDLVSLTEDDLIRIRNLGRKGFEDVKTKLARIGMCLTGPTSELKQYAQNEGRKLPEVIPEPSIRWTVDDVIDIANRCGHAMSKLDVIVWLLENGYTLRNKLTEYGDSLIVDMLGAKEK